MKHLKYLVILVILILASGQLSYGYVKSHIDLRVSEISIDNPIPKKDELVGFTIKVEKLGAGFAENVRLVCKLRHYQVIDVNLDFNKESVITQKYTWKALFGSQTFKCNIDPGDYYYELDEENNEKEISFDVAMPDLPDSLDKNASGDGSKTDYHKDGLDGEESGRRVMHEKPDLVPVALEINNEREIIEILVANKGATFNLDWTYDITWNDNQGKKGTCNGIKKGLVSKYAKFKVTCPIPAGFLLSHNGQYVNFKVHLDSSDFIREDDEINNLSYFRIKIESMTKKIKLNLGE
jgi:hypothetical protein